MSDKYQEVPIYLFGTSSNKIRPEPVGVAVFRAGELTPENLVVVASIYDWRDINHDKEVSLGERIFGLIRNEKDTRDYNASILMTQVASQLMTKTDNPAAWQSYKN